MTTEANIQQAIIEYLALDRKGFFWRNNTGMATYGHRKVMYGKKGSPDIIGTYKGKFIGIEVKKKNGKQSDDQKVFQEWLESAGGIYYLADDVDKFHKWFNKLKKSL